jgi:hypothetical protein
MHRSIRLVYSGFHAVLVLGIFTLMDIVMQAMLIYMYGWMHAWAVSSHQPCFSRPWFGHN